MPAVHPSRPNRREAMALGMCLPLAAWAQTAPADALRGGGVVLAVRHALAPGTFDPPGFRLGDCSTQRNLDDTGRTQARQMGAWFRSRNLQPQRVRTSPWCRCIDTAMLAFGTHEVWPALGSPAGSRDEAYASRQKLLRQELQAARARRAGFEVWVTHMFVLSDLVGQNTDPGEGVVLRANAAGAVEVVALWTPG